MYYSDDLIEEVRLKNDIVDVISSNVKLQKKGSSYFGLCPFHNEKSPSFSVSPDKQMYYCFGCGVGGNVFTFEMEYENYTFQEAVKALADRAGVKLPEADYSPEAKAQADIKASILEINKQAANYFYYRLKSDSGKQGYDYLKERGLLDETIKKFGLGYSSKYSDDLYRYMKEKGYNDNLLKESGLFTYDEKKGVYDKFWNRVMFPIMDINSKVIGFGGRVMSDVKPKYLNSPETKVFDKSRNLYGLNFARSARKGYMLLCEGYMDVIALHQAGFNNAIASLGTALTQGHASLIKRYTDEVYITYDSDLAGIKAALRAIPILKEAGISAKVINMKPYKDPDEFIKNLGAEEYENRIKNATNGFMFELSVLEQEYDMKDPQGKTKFFNEAAKKIVLEFSEDIERDNYIQAVAEKYNTGYDNLRKLVSGIGINMGGIAKSTRPKTGINSMSEKADGMKKSQKLLITWLIEEPKIYGQIKKYIKPDDFSEELYKTVAGILFKQLENGEVNPAQIINHFTNEEEHKEAASLFNARLKEIDTKAEKEKALNETFIRVMQNSIDNLNSSLNPTDLAGLQRVLDLKKNLEEIKKIHIKLD